MIKVYFETSAYCELVAIFANEEAYHACLPALTIKCEEQGFEFISDSVEDGTLKD